jgi:arginase family enzyme
MGATSSGKSVFLANRTFQNSITDQSAVRISISRLLEAAGLMYDDSGEGTKAVAVSLDIDAARQNEAPGASASNPSGLSAALCASVMFWFLKGFCERR